MGVISYLYIAQRLDALTTINLETVYLYRPHLHPGTTHADPQNPSVLDVYPTNRSVQMASRR